ncbi:MAG: threonine--tRNA ligase, partial [Gammaproteobacteria bacterium]
EKSGHWDKFRDDMFTTESEKRTFAIKPMNCPCHIQVFNQGLKSYRELPLRMAEFGSCHRNEPSGTLHGLMRVRGFTQDDAHIFCTEEQIQDEVAGFNELLFEVYRDFGFEDILIKLSTRPEQRVGSDEVWDKAEHALEKALNALGKGTIQVDFSMPGRLGAEYVAEDGSRKTPVMLHRAILGSMERFIGVLIEHYAGIFPLWLAPVQAVVLNITDNQRDYVEFAAKSLAEAGIRAKADLRNEKIGFKIREHTLQKVPYLLVVGDREVENHTVAVRTRAGEDLGTMSLEDVKTKLTNEIVDRGRSYLEE